MINTTLEKLTSACINPRLKQQTLIQIMKYKS